MTLNEYYAALERHDWWHSYSDDARKYAAGDKEEKRLRAAADLSPAHRKLWDAFVEHRATHGNSPKPERPS